ncbi:response regulator transcription factor [Sphingomonas sp. 28-63-12]|uniref:response regulator transcription factor n=1 Tax=Sphingomonas sp. 28-63-12 TaxID=1970434 RepID=UPI000BDC8B42|nr:MAG: hypothetical protein B7Y47_03660 [Sphingomonas sp. 28-63-12]
MESCLIADDHALVRDALSMSVAARWPTATIWEAADYSSAWSLAVRHPDVCLMDLGMAGSEPRSGIAQVRRLAPDARIVIVTAADNDAMMLALLDDGVAGFVSKSANTAVIIAAIELVLAGGKYLPPRIGELAGVAQPHNAMPARLSPRQIDVLRLISDGETNKGIARALEISPATVKVHIAQALSALGATNRTDAAMKARGLGLI